MSGDEKDLLPEITSDSKTKKKDVYNICIHVIMEALDKILIFDKVTDSKKSSFL